MAKWEYSLQTVQPDYNVSVSKLNELGLQGWEVAEVQKGYVLLERQLAEAFIVLVDVDFVVDTVDYAPNDVLADTTKIPNVARAIDTNVQLRSINLIDFDYQGMAMEVIFFSENRKLGPINAKPTITAADMRDQQGTAHIVNSDWANIGTSFKTTNRGNIGMVMKPAAGTRDLYVGIVNAGGSPKFASGKLRGRFGFVQL